MSVKLVPSFILSFLIAYVSSQSLGYSYFQFVSAPSTGYDSFSGIVNVLSDPGTSCDGLFMSHQFFFKGGNGGYFGIQTGAPGGPYDAPLKTQRNRKYISSFPTNRTGPLIDGKVSIFSIWDAVNCETSAGKNTPNIECYKFGGEGSGWSIHMKFNWTVSKYEFKLSKGTKANWWMTNVFINDNINNPIYMGQIEVPSSWGQITGGNGDAFLEKYTGTSGCNGNFPQYASFDYGQIYNDTVFPYHSSYTIGANGVKCQCVTANITSDHYDVDYTINKALGGCD
eukprot:275646_1